MNKWTNNKKINEYHWFWWCRAEVGGGWEHLFCEPYQVEDKSELRGSTNFGNMTRSSGCFILGSSLASRRRHTLFEPMGDALAAGDHHLTLDWSQWFGNSRGAGTGTQEVVENHQQQCTKNGQRSVNEVENSDTGKPVVSPSDVIKDDNVYQQTPTVCIGCQTRYDDDSDIDMVHCHMCNGWQGFDCLPYSKTERKLLTHEDIEWKCQTLFRNLDSVRIRASHK